MPAGVLTKSLWKCDSSKALELSHKSTAIDPYTPWYVLHMPQGHEASLCEKLNRIIPSDILEYAFVLKKERWIKRSGVWTVQPCQMYRGYAFVISSDVEELQHALTHLTQPVELISENPIDQNLAVWFASVMDTDGLIQSSSAAIVNGTLQINQGPLFGQEDSITKIDRHKRMCEVALGTFKERLALNVAYKS